MQFTQLFTDLAKDLTASGMFGSPVVYHALSGKPTYDPMTGTVTPVGAVHNITAGVEQITRTGENGAQETTEIKVWFAATSLPVEPRTSDELEYSGKRWHCTAVNPEFSARRADHCLGVDV